MHHILYIHDRYNDNFRAGYLCDTIDLAYLKLIDYLLQYWEGNLDKKKYLDELIAGRWYLNAVDLLTNNSPDITWEVFKNPEVVSGVTLREVTCTANTPGENDENE